MVTVLFALLLVFLTVPVVEIYIVVKVSQSTGVLNAVVLLILVSLAGVWLVRREGFSILRRVQVELAAGRLPGRQIVDGLILLFAGALMLTPGFGTDVLGLVLLFPPIRITVREFLIRRFAHQIGVD